MDPIHQRILATFDQLDRDSLDLHTLLEFVGGNPPAQREAVFDAVSALVKDGLLSEVGGGDFFMRTEDGRLAVAGPRDITLYTREGCHLCEEAKVVISPMLAEFGATFREVDIDDNPVLRERYTNDVPVIFVGSQMFARHRLDAAYLRRQLQQAKP
jgi:glutaredoxin